MAHAYAGCDALVKLHDAHMRACLAEWRRARAAAIELPETDDPDYASLETLLVHVLSAARGYMTWCCAKLELPDPGIRSAPSPEAVADDADAYLEHVLHRWDGPLHDVPPEAFAREFKSGWGETYSIDSMLEHAVMHPIRHAYQLGRLLASSNR